MLGCLLVLPTVHGWHGLSKGLGIGATCLHGVVATTRRAADAGVARCATGHVAIVASVAR